MPTDRRDFLGQLAVGALAVTQAAKRQPDLEAISPQPALAADEWDLSWVERIKGKHRALFDCPEIEAGRGFLRALFWRTEYMQALGAKAEDLSAVVVFRHHGIALAMGQGYWDRYKIGKELKVQDPFTGDPTTKNPVLLPTKETPAALGDLSLGGFVASGGIVLGCWRAFKDCVARVAGMDGVDEKEAEKRARALLIPDVILQPSGVFAAIRAQEAGCAYVRAS